MPRIKPRTPGLQGEKLFATTPRRLLCLCSFKSTLERDEHSKIEQSDLKSALFALKLRNTTVALIVNFCSRVIM